MFAPSPFSSASSHALRRHSRLSRARRGHLAVASVARVSTQSMLHRLWRRGQRGWPASFPGAQFPNAPLLVALGGWRAAAPTAGSLHSYARAVFYAALAAWAWQELAGGANWVRR